MPIVTLSEMSSGQEADLFLLMTAKEELTTKLDKPYFKVGFRDGTREVSFPIWNDSPWGVECRERWNPGVFYKVRAVYRETNFGPQLEIRKIREVVDADAADGFDPHACMPRSRFDSRQMYDELLSLAREHIRHPGLLRLVETIFAENESLLLVLPAARRNHHAYISGLLEHSLSVTRTAIYLADKYAEYYPEMKPALDKGMAVAGGMLHDIGKLREIEPRPEGTAHTAEGSLIGHILSGRDIVRETAATLHGEPTLDRETLLRLEHLIIAHQRLPEWGSPKPPMTPEALLVHYADDIDAKFHMMVAVLRDDATPGPVTSRKNALMQQVYRGESEN